MQEFIRKFEKKASFVLSGFDRVVFRGLLRALIYPDGMKTHLSCKDVPRRHFGQHVERTTEALKQASLAEAKALDRPIRYLASSRVRKEAEARKLLASDPVDSGLVCVLTCVEPCKTYEMYRNREAKRLELVYRERKCLHLYHYYLDPCFGWMHARIQTWYPFHVQVCINGREWLARRMDEAGIAYTRHENSFPVIEDPVRAQELMHELVAQDWPRVLDGFAHRLNPAHDELLAPHLRYYWTAHQTEWATDVAFTSSRDLQHIYPQLVWGAITAFSSRDVLRFLGKQYQCHFAGEVTSHYRDRPEGLSIRHQANNNGVKMYDKAGRILRIETTINNPTDITVYRPKQGDEPKQATRAALRKGVCDLSRRAQVSQRANERYLDALSHLDTDQPLGRLLAPMTQRVCRSGAFYRGLRPWEGHDLDLLALIQRPEYHLGGFRNVDIARELYPRHHASPHKRRTASARVSYRLRLLRAHGLIRKQHRSRRYRITKKGQEICAALSLAQHATVQQLTAKAA